MKFSTSLLRMPGASSVAPSRLSAKRADRRAGHDRQQRLERDRSEADGQRRRAPTAPTRPAAVPSSDIAPGRARRHGPNAAAQRPRAAAPRLADLARDRCRSPPAASAATNRDAAPASRRVATAPRARPRWPRRRCSRWRCRRRAGRRALRRCRAASCAAGRAATSPTAQRNVSRGAASIPATRR